MAPNITEYDAGNLALRPSETGVEARAATARRVGAFYNQKAGAQGLLASETERLGAQTAKLGSETAGLGDLKGSLTADTGRRIGASISDAGDAAVKYLDHQQISHGSATYANTWADATQQWKATLAAADPNDPTVAQKFMGSLEDRLAKFKEDGFYTEGGQKWAEAHVDALRMHMLETTQGDMATLAGDAVRQNQRQTLNKLSSTVHDDPSQANVDFALGSLKSTNAGLISTSPNLSGVQAGKLRSEFDQTGAESIVKSGVIGYLAQNGVMPAWLKDPKYAPFVNGAELKQFEQAAQYYKNLNHSEARSAQQQQDRQAKDDFNKKINRLEASTMPQNPGDKPQLPDDYWQQLRTLSAHPGAAFEPARLKVMVDAGNQISSRLNKPEPMATASARFSMDIMTKMRATDDSHVDGEQEANKAYGDGEITSGDRNMLVKEWRDSKTSDGESLAKTKSAFFDAVEPMIVKPMGDMFDDTAKLRLYRFQTDVNRKVDEFRRAGKNPRDLFDPTKPDFLGNPDFINQPQYQNSLQGNLPALATGRPSVNLTGNGSVVTGIQTTALPPVPKREKGESLDAWMKRTGRGIALPPATGPTAPASN